jgi:hypothetical protein
VIWRAPRTPGLTRLAVTSLEINGLCKRNDFSEFPARFAEIMSDFLHKLFLLVDGACVTIPRSVTPMKHIRLVKPLPVSLVQSFTQEQLK